MGIRNDQKKKIVNNFKAKTEQNLNIIVIDPKLTERFRLKFQKISKLNSRKMCISVANGKKIVITHWVKFWVNVAGIGKKIVAFVNQKNHPFQNFFLNCFGSAIWMLNLEKKN